MTFPSEFEVVITQKDVEESTSFVNNTDCPLAKFAKRKFQIRHVRVGTENITIYSTSKVYFYRLKTPFLSNIFNALKAGERAEFRSIAKRIN